MKQRAFDEDSSASSTGPSNEVYIPPTVQGVLATRIDRLPPKTRALLQTMAVIGRRFSLSLLTLVMDEAGDELYQLIDHLRQAEFIYEETTHGEAGYRFKHELTKEVTYDSLTVEQRSALHERAGLAIETLFHHHLQDHYSELAYHYSRSGNTRKAVEYLTLVGQQTLYHGAYETALIHLTAAVELLKALPDTIERTQWELLLEIALGEALSFTKGHGEPRNGGS